MRKLIVLGTLALGLVGLTMASRRPIQRTPRPHSLARQTCDNGQSFQIVINGNGVFSAAHDRNSTATFIMFAFGEFTGTVTDPAGNVVDTFTDPPVTKRAAANHSLLECLFTFSQTLPDGSTLTCSGTSFVEPVRSR